MRTIVPDFYSKFSCKAGKCQHSCCRENWEIDVDDATAERYFVMPDPLGKELRENIHHTKDGYYIKKRPDGSCPFFRKDGLCRLVLAMGDDCLCDICALHPRFFGMVSTHKGDVELGGVGLACEKSCELLLADDRPLKFCFFDDKKRTFSLAELLPRLGITLKEENLHFKLNRDPDYIMWMFDLLAKTEPIDASWTWQIKALQGRAGEIAATLGAVASVATFDKIYQYILYRHLGKVKTCYEKKLLTFAQLNTEFIYLDTAATGNLPESLRRWSRQIEYDDDNIDFLFSSDLL